MGWEPEPPPRTLRDHADVLRRHLGIVLGVTLITTLGALALSLSGGSTYQATAEVLFPQDPPTVADPLDDQLVDRQRLDAERVVQNEARLATGDEVRDEVVARIGPDGSASARAVPDADVIVVTGRASDADRAAEVANTTADVYVAVRTQQRQRLADAAVAAAEAELAALDEQLAAVAGGPADERARATLEERRAGWLAQLQRLEAEAAFVEEGAPTVIDRAGPPSSPSGTGPMSAALLGAVAGLLLGVTAAYVVEALGERRSDHADAAVPPDR